MNKKLDSIPQPKDYLHKIEILKLVAQQIEKDFAEANIQIEITETPEKAFSEILKQISQQLYWLLNHNNTKLYQLLYRIDLSEQKLKKIMVEDLRDTSHVIAEQILLREFQKVLFRLQYSNNPNLKSLLKLK